MSDIQQHQDEQIFSTTSEPTVEIIEEVQPDGTIVRKKRTTRKITKRVLTTTTSAKEEESDNNQQQQLQHDLQHDGEVTATFESSESTLKDLSVGSAAATAETVVVGSTTTTTTTTSIATTTADSASTTTAATTVIDASSEATESEATESDEAFEKSATTEQSKRTFKYGLFGKGNVDDHPFYKFLARFPLKQSPAPHTRPRPVKPTLYAFAPGWKIGGGAAQDAEKHDNKEGAETKKDTIIGSFDVDSLKWMVISPCVFALIYASIFAFQLYCS
jgi:hypothetical protein